MLNNDGNCYYVTVLSAATPESILGQGGLGLLYAASSVPPALHASFREFLDLILDQARDIILIIALDGRILYANQAATAAYGYAPTEFATLSISDLRTADTLPLLDQQLKSAHQQGLLFRTRHRRKTGDSFPVEVSTRNFALNDSSAVISTVRDITAVVAAETALRDSERKHQQLSEDLGAANEELTAANEELTAINEELTATDEILRNQLDDLLQKEAEISRQNQLLTVLHEIATGLMESRSRQELLTLLVAAATRLADTPHGFIYILDQPAGVFRRTHGVGLYADDIGRELGSDGGIAGQVLRTGSAVVVNHYQQWLQTNAASFQHPEITAVLQAPLKAEAQTIGTIGLAYCDPAKSFGPAELDILTRFAAMASIALANAQLMDSLRREIGERKLTETALQNAQAGNQALMSAIPDMMFTLDRAGVFLDYKNGVDEFLLPPEIFLGKSVPMLFPPALASQVMLHLDRAFAGNEVQHFHYEIQRNGQAEHYEARICVIAADRALAICRNVTERFLMEEQLKHLSLHDALTGCYNRTFFEEEMRRLELERGSRPGLLICDVDGLKLINDSLGHAAGDEILKEVARILAAAFRAGDLISRIGGDEFAVLLPTASDRTLTQVKRRIRRHIDEHNAKNQARPISLSIGFAVNAGEPVDMNNLFKKADNNMYREKLHQKNSAGNAIVQGMIKSLESRDYLTDGHGERLTRLSENFAKRIGLPEQRLPDLRLLAQFHDIGKVGIPDRILFKPTALTPEEWEVMRQHSEIGYRIAVATPALAPIADLIMRHQEWWNGSGYPLGLKGEAIPLECRILAIIDAYDAMTSNRPYRTAVASQTALKEIRRCAGTQFDPGLAEDFDRMLGAILH